MADAVATLGLRVTADGAVADLAKFDAATTKSGKSADVTAKQIDGTNAALSRNAVQSAAAAQSLAAYQRQQDLVVGTVRQNVAVQAASGTAFAGTATAAGASTVAIRSRDVALVEDAIASGNSANAAKALIASWGAETVAANTATVAIERHTLAKTAGVGASAAATAGTGLLARGVAALGGPIGVAVAAITALQVGYQLYETVSAKAAEATKKQAAEFDKLSDAAKIAAVSVRLANEEAARVQAVSRKESAGASGNLFGVLQADRDLQTLNPAVAASTKQLAELNAGVKETGKSLQNVFAQGIADADAELRAFARTGVDGVEVYRLANAEWLKSAGANRTLEAALKSGDAEARKLVFAAAELAAKQQLVTKATKDAAEAQVVAAKRTKDAIKDAADAKRDFESAYSASLIGTAQALAEAESDRAIALQKAGVAADAAAAKVQAATLFQLSQARLQAEALSATEDEARKLQLRLTFLQKLSEGFGILGAAAFAAESQSIKDANGAAKDYSDTLQELYDKLGKIIEQQDKAAKSQFSGALGAGLSFVQNPSSQSAGALASEVTGIPLVGSVVTALADTLDLFGTKAAAARKRQEEYNRSLDDFTITSRTSLEAQLKENAARANALVQQAAGAVGATVTGLNVKSADDLAAFIALIPANVRAFSKLRAELVALESVTRANEEALKARNAAELKALGEDLAVRALRAKGLGEEADALAFTTAQTRERIAIDDQYKDAALNAALATVQAAEAQAFYADAAKKAAAKIEEARRTIFDFGNNTLAFTDPRAATANAQTEERARRISDAMAQGASSAQIIAIELFNAAEQIAQAAALLESDTRTTESLTSRGLKATGFTAQADDVAFASGQRQELADAIAAGISPFNLELLKFVQFAEASQRQMLLAIQAGTDAINKRADNEIAANNVLIEVIRSTSQAEIAKLDQQIDAAEKAARATDKAYQSQIDAVREAAKAQTDAIDAQIAGTRQALDVAKSQLSQLEKSVATSQRVVEALTDFTNSQKLGDLSSLSPEDKLAEARRQFETRATAAQGGDAEAAASLPGAANALLQASRAFNASNTGFVQDESRVQDVVGAVTAQFGRTLPTDLQTLEAARNTVAGLERTIDALGQQKDAIQRAAERQIAVLQSAKDKAAADAQNILAGLRERRDTISKDADETIKKLETTNAAIRQAAIDQIAVLTANELAAHNQRLKDNAFYDTFLNFTGVNPNAGTGVPVGGPLANSTSRVEVEPDPVATETLAVTRALHADIKALLSEIRAEAIRGNTIALAAAEEITEAEHGTTRAVGLLAQATSQAANAAAARAGRK